jgi:hypothetical protein
MAMTDVLVPPLMGPRHIVPTVAGDVCLYVRGRGRPLLLIHSVNAAASSAEVRPLEERYRHSRRVYSMDLPGFGLSERAPRPYSPRLMTDAVLAFKVLSQPVVIRHFLKKTWGSRRIDEELYRYDVRTVRQPGAEFAPLRFVCGSLFSADIQNIYPRLPMPVWMARGVNVDFNEYRHEWIVSRLPNWSFSRFATGAFPHFEALDYFCEDYDRWIDQVVAPRYHRSGPPFDTQRRFK